MPDDIAIYESDVTRVADRLRATYDDPDALTDDQWRQAARAWLAQVVQEVLTWPDTYAWGGSYGSGRLGDAQQCVYDATPPTETTA